MGGVIIIITIIIISSIKTIKPVFSLFCASCFNHYTFKRKNSYALLTSLKYSSAWFGDMRIKYVQCLSVWYIRAISDNSFFGGSAAESCGIPGIKLR